MQESLHYKLLNEDKQPHLQIKHYEMISQHWSPHKWVKPELWRHTVDIYLPQQALPHRALVYINNGINYTIPPTLPSKTDGLSADALANIAIATQTIIVALKDVPNQYLAYQDNGIPRREDASVAKSWQLFMQDPDTMSYMSLHIPMTIAVQQAMNLAQREMTPYGIKHFILSGASKRAWVSWLVALVDKRVDAIVPFAFDLLNTRMALHHIYRSYGKHWPIAFTPYVKEGIAARIDSDAFRRLMTVEDPLQYRQTSYDTRLNIIKYIVNNSGDDFYVPDNTRFYFDSLPGDKALCVLPNSSHYDVKKAIEPSLIAFIRRYQRDLPLPELLVNAQTSGNQQKLKVRFSEKPQRVVLWTAYNPEARDFRYQCGIVDQPTLLAISRLNTVTERIEIPKKGWQATFIEATFSDGFSVTSQVYITPDQNYPDRAPLAGGPACRTLDDTP